MSQHTPGPWKYWHEKGYVGEINAQNGTLVAGFDTEPNEDNARLLAAAPELLEALQTALQAFSEMNHARTRPEWFTRGREAAVQHEALWEKRGIEAVIAAIEKATGRKDGETGDEP